VAQNFGRPDGTSVVSTYDVNKKTLLNANFVTGLNGGDNFMLVVTAQPPIANAGPGQTVQAGNLATLNGGGSSDPSGQLPLTYAWSIVSQPGGGTAVLSNNAIVNPTFTPNAEGNYVIQLVVTDAAGLSSSPASVTISTIDAPPVANAGPSQTITAPGTLVHLDGTQSYDLAGLAITYQWSFGSKPAGSNATLTGPAAATPSFVADVAGNYSVQLVVTDSLGTVSSPSSMLVNPDSLSHDMNTFDTNPEEYDLVVLGSGAGGKLIAWTSAQKGQRVVVIERKYVGGACPNIACLPSKNIIHSAKVASFFYRSEEFGISKENVRVNMAAVRERKRKMVQNLVDVHLDLYKRSGAELVMGMGRFVGPKTIEAELNGGGTRTFRGKNVVINTGSRATLEPIHGLAEVGPLTHIEALELDQIPKHLLVLGAGYVGLELAQAFRRFGAEVNSSSSSFCKSAA
jgi:hypothetical protein